MWSLNATRLALCAVRALEERSLEPLMHGLQQAWQMHLALERRTLRSVDLRTGSPQLPRVVFSSIRHSAGIGCSAETASAAGNKERACRDSSAVTAAGMNPLHLSVLDNTAPTYAEIQQLLGFVTASANEPAYCHCKAGVGRTRGFCASDRNAACGYTTADAIVEAKKCGLALQSQIGFLQTLGPDILAGKIAGYPRFVMAHSNSGAHW